jgi:hypothetical protein
MVNLLLIVNGAVVFNRNAVAASSTRDRRSCRIAGASAALATATAT